jgi:hypothetical protein
MFMETLGIKPGMSTKRISETIPASDRPLPNPAEQLGAIVSKYNP